MAETEKSPIYVRDIEKGNNRTPDEELLNDMFFHLGDNELSIKNKLSDLAAIECGVVSADITDFIMQDDDLHKVIRLVKANEQVRDQIINIVK